MSDRSKRIEECARALLDGSEGIKLNAGTAEVMNYWNRYRELRAALRAALSLPPDAPDATPGWLALDWPNRPFRFADDPGEHDPCYVVTPNGDALPLNHHATPGVDIARARWIIAACNAALSAKGAPDEYRRGVEDAAKTVEDWSGGDWALGSLVVNIRALVADAPPPAPGACERCGEEWAWESACTNPKCPACHGEGAEP